MINIDRVINIHQSCTQEQIKALNKETLKNQYAQSQLINQIQKDLEVANATSKAMLRNQLKELQQKEEQNYYKNLSFHINELVNYISNINQPLVKYFLCELYLSVINASIEDSINKLIEIQDKIFCSETLNKLNDIRVELQSYQDDFKSSPFANMINLERNYNELKKEERINEIFIRFKYQKKEFPLSEKLQGENPLKNPRRTFGIYFFSISVFISLLFSLFALYTNPEVLIPFIVIFVLPPTLILYILVRKDRRWKKNYSNYIQQTNEREKQEQTCILNRERQEQIELEQNAMQSKSHPYILSKKEADLLYPNWLDVVEKADKIFGKIFTPQKNDSLFCEAARYYFINSTNIAIKKIEDKFSISRNRASSIVGQLQQTGIMKSSHFSQEIAFKNPIDLELALYDCVGCYVEPSNEYINELQKRDLLVL